MQYNTVCRFSISLLLSLYLCLLAYFVFRNSNYLPYLLAFLYVSLLYLPPNATTTKLQNLFIRISFFFLSLLSIYISILLSITYISMRMYVISAPRLPPATATATDQQQQLQQLQLPKLQQNSNNKNQQQSPKKKKRNENRTKCF